MKTSALKTEYEVLRRKVENRIYTYAPFESGKHLFFTNCVMFDYVNDEEYSLVSQLSADRTVGIELPGKTRFVGLDSLPFSLLLDILEELELGRFNSIEGIQSQLPDGVVVAN